MNMNSVAADVRRLILLLSLLLWTSAHAEPRKTNLILILSDSDCAGKATIDANGKALQGVYRLAKRSRSSMVKENRLATLGITVN